MRTDEAALDRMLVEHDERHGTRIDELLTGYDLSKPSLHQQVLDAATKIVKAEDVPLQEERVPDWPKVARHWTPEWIAERRRWVRKLYGDQNLTADVVAERLGIANSTVMTDALAMGIGHKAQGRLGDGNVRQVRLQKRRARVKALYEQGLSAQEIAVELGAHDTTIHKDIRALGITRTPHRAPPAGLAALVGRAVDTMDQMAQLLLDHPDLHLLRVDVEQSKNLERQLKRIVRAAGRVRKPLKEEP